MTLTQNKSHSTHSLSYCRKNSSLREHIFCCWNIKINQGSEALIKWMNAYASSNICFLEKSKSACAHFLFMDIGLILFSKNNLTKFARRSFLPLTRRHKKVRRREWRSSSQMGSGRNLQPKSSMGGISWSSNGDSPKADSLVVLTGGTLLRLAFFCDCCFFDPYYFAAAGLSFTW